MVWYRHSKGSVWDQWDAWSYCWLMNFQIWRATKDHSHPKKSCIGILISCNFSIDVHSIAISHHRNQIEHRPVLYCRASEMTKAWPGCGCDLIPTDHHLDHQATWKIFAFSLMIKTIITQDVFCSIADCQTSRVCIKSYQKSYKKHFDMHTLPG